MTAEILFGSMDKFFRHISEFEGQNVTIKNVQRVLEISSYKLQIDVPFKDFRPLINYLKKQQRIEIYGK